MTHVALPQKCHRVFFTTTWYERGDDANTGNLPSGAAMRRAMRGPTHPHAFQSGNYRLCFPFDHQSGRPRHRRYPRCWSRPRAPGSSISPFSQDCGTRVSRQYLQMAAEGSPSDRIAAAMALHGSIALHIDLTRSTKASGSRGIRVFSQGHGRIGTRSQPRSWTLATRVARLRMHPASARSMGLINS